MLTNEPEKPFEIHRRKKTIDTDLDDGVQYFLGRLIPW